MPGPQRHKKRQYKPKPHEKHKAEQPQTPQTANDPFDLSQLGETLEIETVDTPSNPWNPTNHTTNCVYMGLSHVTGLPLEHINNAFWGGEPPPGGLPPDKVYEAAQHLGLRITESPPPEEYFEDGGRAAVWYTTPQGTGHVAEVERGSDERNMTYVCWQSKGTGQDVTDGVRKSANRYYIHKAEDPSDSDDV